MSISAAAIQGPHTLTFGLRLYEPTQKNINKALGLRGAIEAAIADSPVRIYTDRGVLYVETPSPTPVTVDGAKLRGEQFAVPLGMTSRQSVTGVDLIINPHLLLVGPTNRGKTTAARLVAYHLARQNPSHHARFIVSTFKPKDWQAFSSLAHTFAVITDPDESAQMARYLVEVMHNRTKSGQDSPHLFVFLDDLLNLLSVADVDGELAQLASLGRAAGIHLIIGTQRLGEKGAAGGLVTGNIPTRLVFGTADAQDAALFTGRGGSGAERLGRYPGDALLVTDGGTQRVGRWLYQGRAACSASAKLRTNGGLGKAAHPRMNRAYQYGRKGANLALTARKTRLWSVPVRSPTVRRRRRNGNTCAACMRKSAARMKCCAAPGAVW